MHAPPVTCAFTGHRPEKLPWGSDETDARCAALKAEMLAVLRELASDGYTHFISGMAKGCDLYFAEAVLSLIAEGLPLTLEAAIPFRGHGEHWPEALAQRFRAVLDSAEVTYLAERYHAGCMLVRDRYLVDHAGLLLTYFDGTSGGTRYTVEYALRRKVPVRYLSLQPFSPADAPDEVNT